MMGNATDVGILIILAMIQNVLCEDKYATSAKEKITLQKYAALKDFAFTNGTIGDYHVQEILSFALGE